MKTRNRIVNFWNFLGENLFGYDGTSKISITSPEKVATSKWIFKNWIRNIFNSIRKWSRTHFSFTSKKLNMCFTCNNKIITLFASAEIKPRNTQFSIIHRCHWYRSRIIYNANCHSIIIWKLYCEAINVHHFWSLCPYIYWRRTGCA